MDSAPRRAFMQTDHWPLQNDFKTDQSLEAKDARNTSAICVATIVEMRGPRLRLRLDGTDGMNDFWRLTDSKDIFPIGTCKAHGGLLQPPLGFIKKVSMWHSYIQKRLQIVDRPDTDCFIVEPSKPPKNLFQIGQKLEAVDRKNEELICPATVGDVKGDKIFITFDGWRGAMDYECDYYSRDIFPVGWCEANGHFLQPPGTKGDNPQFAEKIKEALEMGKRKTRSSITHSSSGSTTPLSKSQTVATRDKPVNRRSLTKNNSSNQKALQQTTSVDRTSEMSETLSTKALQEDLINVIALGKSDVNQEEEVLSSKVSCASSQPQNDAQDRKSVSIKQETTTPKSTSEDIESNTNIQKSSKETTVIATQSVIANSCEDAKDNISILKENEKIDEKGDGNYKTREIAGKYADIDDELDLEITTSEVKEGKAENMDVEPEKNTNLKKDIKSNDSLNNSQLSNERNKVEVCIESGKTVHEDIMDTDKMLPVTSAKSPRDDLTEEGFSDSSSTHSRRSTNDKIPKAVKRGLSNSSDSSCKRQKVKQCGSHQQQYNEEVKKLERYRHKLQKQQRKAAKTFALINKKSGGSAAEQVVSSEHDHTTSHQPSDSDCKKIGHKKKKKKKKHSGASFQRMDGFGVVKNGEPNSSNSNGASNLSTSGANSFLNTSCTILPSLFGSGGSSGGGGGSSSGGSQQQTSTSKQMNNSPATILRSATSGWPPRLSISRSFMVSSDNKLGNFSVRDNTSVPSNKQQESDKNNISDDAVFTCKLASTQQLPRTTLQDSAVSAKEDSAEVATDEKPSTTGSNTNSDSNAVSSTTAPEAMVCATSPASSWLTDDNNATVDLEQQNTKHSSPKAIADTTTKSRSRNPKKWTIRDVCNYVTEKEPALKPHVGLFQKHEIDGLALLLINSGNVKYMSLKLGPSLKLCSIVASLKKAIADRCNQLETTDLDNK